MLSRIVDPILSLAFPQACHVCRNKVRNSDRGVACDDCWSSTRVFSTLDVLCGKCGLPLETEGKGPYIRCGKCTTLEFDQASACGVYEKALSAAILHLKRVPVIPRMLRQIAIAALGNFAISPLDVIVIPVPLSAGRVVERGFNQAEVIANLVASALHAPVDKHSLRRTRHTPLHRAGMDRRAREATVKNAFEVTRPRLVEGRSILLIDDVLTSGATASACAGELKKNGAAEVNLFTLARAVTLY